MFRVLLSMVALLAELVVSVFLIDQAGALLSAASTVSVIGGLILLGMITVFGGWGAYRLAQVFVAQLRKYAASLDSTSTRSSTMVILTVATIALFNGACTTISPGTVGIKVSNYGSNRGVQDYTLQTGMVWYMPGVSKVFEYPTYVQTVKWTATADEGSPRNEEFVFNSKDAAVIKADISLSYQLDPKKVPAFYVKFRSDNLEDFTDGFLHNVARDAFQEEAVNYTALELYGEKKDVFLKAVQDHITAKVDSLGVEITQFGLMGNLRLPDEITSSVVAKIAATQNAIKAQNEVAQATAQAQSAVAKARGESEANRLLTQSLSSQLIAWRALDIQGQAIVKWNGVLPQFTTGNGIPLIQMPAPQANH